MGDPDQAMVVFDIRWLDDDNLSSDIPSGDVWNGTLVSDNVVGRIVSGATGSAGHRLYLAQRAPDTISMKMADSLSC